MITQVAVFVLGLIFGSFLNVCIARMPKGESVVWPGSRCPSCLTPIAWHQNIPLISYLGLKGRCSSCKKVISVRYFIVELLSGGLWLWMWHEYGFSLFFAAAVFYLSVLLVVTITDFETGLIPDALTIPGMILGLMLCAVEPAWLGEASRWKALARSAAGLLAGGGILWLTGWLGSLIFRKDSMGGGDIKLLAMMGSFLGVSKVILIFFLAPFLALPAALYMRWVMKSDTIIFGPYLAIAGAAMMVYGDVLMKIFYPWMTS